MTEYHHYVNTWRAYGVSCLILLALMIRSIIPVGYMPDTTALRDGRIIITFCITPGNALAVPAVLAGLFATDDQQPETVLAGNECPFSLISHQALGVPVLPAVRVLPVGIFSRPLPAFDNTALPTGEARGPPLGSRAPPFFFS
ncbi:DUF2946 domain-containing protein [Alcaligenaceae bacterium]|nr:DUF2946 domain-containing protein [Alcaligenaceae bacterium]